MNILEKIIVDKYKEVAERKSLVPVKLLEKSTFFEGKVVSMKKYVTHPEKSGIISEFKRKSPSKGMINGAASVETVSIGYMQAGASALSILTDKDYFGGSNEDLKIARKFNFCPILRKDFVVDEYQIIEAKSIGADCILLIAAALEPEKLKSLAYFAKSLGLEVLLEVHDGDELAQSINDGVDLIGVNNRNLKTFEVSIDTSLELVDKIPSSFIKISESGISDPNTLIKLKKAGFDGFLIGENFMKSSRPEQAAYNFIKDYQKLASATEFQKA
ncbi:MULTISPECIES: indole-3-glycerol phosphate synthase TrpC [unclassified Algoriphagus]|jgi:indole-3-glycerol phosphate synthase|uniref:indole-3-glycerol phosphate synthase TrpC n=2 Tax=Algoriphagus TaxID=246875 RepID=UPI000C426C9C|nr:MULTISPECIES: indole-3-glycerol phosphate synthase TrpC [unclassified Algoriphagus]MAL12542.1 indole-3-glycerol phosphate synthase [Algoriphagus sp.]HAD50515.1 indole-3-glycerol phosphate synthase TrpC [Algoriphagus sp.]HAH36087.1 indole-3-glycerol phosphate synthase TrpC [Algoriphagus sp.]HAS57021.1 indole-3-glycerol phosphate synthase TrpC [Algoriphagus sp.]HCB47731.1 indole-3-glycerol phosphate synthase TrpC [Algoriphagus sp.]|tara:strand:- start:10280 stop:11098 length:819 start_codon:yes stop_codon:yes gene_type:complete